MREGTSLEVPSPRPKWRTFPRVLVVAVAFSGLDISCAMCTDSCSATAGEDPKVPSVPFVRSPWSSTGLEPLGRRQGPSQSQWGRGSQQE